MDLNIIKTMFPRISFVMVLCAGLLLIAASIVNSYSGNPVNKVYLGIGIVFAVFGLLMLFFRKSRPAKRGDDI